MKQDLTDRRAKANDEIAAGQQFDYEKVNALKAQILTSTLSIQDP